MLAPGAIVVLLLTGCLQAPPDPTAGDVDASSDSDGGVIAAGCTLSDFADDFNDSDYQTVWPGWFENQQGMLATISQQGVITLMESPAWAGFVSAAMNLTGTCTYGEVIEVPNHAADSAAEAWFALSSAENTAVYFHLTRNRLSCSERIEDEVTSTVDLGAFDPVAHRWWRLRDEGNGTMACDVSPDSQSWSRLGGVAMTLDVSSARIVWMGGTWEAMAEPGVFRIDNVND